MCSIMSEIGLLILGDLAFWSSFSLYPTGKSKTEVIFFCSKFKSVSNLAGMKPSIGQESIFSKAQTVNKFPKAI